MTDLNLRCQVENAMIDAQPPVPDGTCIGGTATDMADDAFYCGRIGTAL